MDENDLILSAQKGNLDSFNRLVHAYQDMVYNQAYRILGEQQPAEDASQEAFISAYRSIGKFRGGSLKAWLLRIVTNACYDELRRRKRYPTTPLEPMNMDHEEIESPGWLEDPENNPEKEMEEGELRKILQRCLEMLPFEFRTAVVLVDIQGLDYTQAAFVIGKPVGTIKSRLARARDRMRECLRKSGELLPLAYRLEGENES